MSRSTTKAAAVTFECVLLLWYALDHKNSEFGVFIADFPGFQICRRSIRGLRLLHVLKNRQNDARCWRFARDSCGLATGYKLFLAALFEGFHSERDVLLRISVFVRHIDLRDDVSGRLGLSMKPLDRCVTEASSREHCDGNLINRFHGFPPVGLMKPYHSITSSARAISVGGTVRPSVLAVLRLITNSNLVGA